MPRFFASRVLCLFLVLLVLPVDAVTAQSNESTFSNRSLTYGGLFVTNDPGEYAMGGGTVALRGRPGAVDVNPAAIGQDGRIQAGVDAGLDPFLQSDFIFGQTITSPFITIKSNRWAAGLQFVQFSYGEFEQRSPSGRSLGTVEKRHRTVKAFGAYDVSDTWAVGAAVGYSAEGFVQPDVDDARSLTIDLGVHGEWERTLESGGRLRPSVGLSLTDFGANSTIVDGDGESPGFESPGHVEVATPTRLHAGAALVYEAGAEPYGRPALRLTGHLGLTKELVRIEEGPNGRDAANPFAALIQSWKPADTEVTLDADGVVRRTSVGAWGQLQKHVGMEVTALDVVSVRVGRNFVDDTFIVSETVAGVGLDLVYVQIDYAHVIASSSAFRDELSYLRVTASLPLDGQFNRHWW